MYDRKLILKILIILNKSLDDFVKIEEGSEKLDSICMQLITIREGLKVTKGTLFVKYLQIEWNEEKRMRDIIAYHYFQHR